MQGIQHLNHPNRFVERIGERCHPIVRLNSVLDEGMLSLESGGELFDGARIRYATA